MAAGIDFPLYFIILGIYTMAPGSVFLMDSGGATCVFLQLYVFIVLSLLLFSFCLFVILDDFFILCFTLFFLLLSLRCLFVL